MLRTSVRFVEKVMANPKSYSVSGIAAVENRDFYSKAVV